jgi:serine/threonine protein kinase
MGVSQAVTLLAFLTSLLQDKSQHFALKVFKEARTDKNILQLKQNLKYEQEYGVLKNLKKFKASTHDHMLESFAAWSHRDSFNILFALADCNLRTFMNNYGASNTRSIQRYLSTHLPLLDKTFVKWLLHQIYGLCDGIKHLHRLEPSAPSPRLEVSPHGKSAAFHHDIKPENILVALDPHSGYGTLKFGDFGSANVQTLRNSAIYKPTTVGEKIHTGTITYEAPDLYITGSATRKADIWSLGCVFLEIMVWCFIPNGLKTFSQERLEVHRDEPHISTDRFWTPMPGNLRENLKDAALNTAVTEKLDNLEQIYCLKKRAFERVLFYIRQMLIVNVDKKSNKPLRIAAPELENDMKVILDQAEIDLKKQPDFYIQSSSAELSEEVLKPAPPTPSSLGAQLRNPAELDENAHLPQPARGDELQPLGSLRSGHLPDQTSIAAVGGMFADTDISSNAATDITRFRRELQRNSSSPLP